MLRSANLTGFPALLLALVFASVLSLVVFSGALVHINIEDLAGAARLLK